MTSSHCAAMQMSLIIGTLLAARSLAVNFVDNIAANGNTVVARRYFANITIINITIIVRWGALTESAQVYRCPRESWYRSCRFNETSLVGFSDNKAAVSWSGTWSGWRARQFARSYGISCGAKFQSILVTNCHYQNCFYRISPDDNNN